MPKEEKESRNFPALFDLFEEPIAFPRLWSTTPFFDRLNQLAEFGMAEKGLNIYEDDSNLYVEANMPGLSKKDIDISLKDNSVWIKGEKEEKEEDKQKNKRFYRRSQRSFSYRVNLPAQVEESAEKAEYKDGVLKLTFKKTTKGNVRKINVS